MILNHGVRGSIPTYNADTSYYGGSTPCVEIVTNEAQVIFDCGTGFSKVNFSNNLPSIIIISHFHHDHIQGIPFNKTLSEKSKKIFISTAFFNKDKLKQTLTNYFSPPFFPINYFSEFNNINFVDFKDLETSFKNFNFKSFKLNHPGDAFGYSLIINNKKFCYLLDNEFYDNQFSSLIDFCEGSNSIIWDGMYTENELKTKKGWGHSSIEQGLKFAEKLDLNNLIISHHSPDRTDQQINDLIEKYSNYKIQFASENKNLKLWTE